MNNSVKTDEVIFNFFKQICDEKDDNKCIKLGNDWVRTMETSLKNMETNLEESDKIKHKEGISNNKNHLNSLKGKTANEWRDYATQCMVEILDNKKQ